MKLTLLLLIALQLSLTAHAAELPSRHWTLDAPTSPDFVAHGKATVASGVRDSSLKLDGHSLLELKNSAGLVAGDRGFTFAIWANPYALDRDQQMIAGKNRYSLSEREWGVMIDRDGLFRLYVQQGGWKTVAAKATPKLGHWHHVVVVIQPKRAELWINGKLAGLVPLNEPVPQTKAPLTLGGIGEGGGVRQAFHGALDEAVWFDHALSSDAIAALYTPVSATHEPPKQVKPFVLWDESRPLAKADELPVVDGAEFHVIKKWDKPADGYTFLHGVGLAWHKGKLYASIGHNKGEENTVTEEAQYRVSADGGKTWSELRVIDAGEEENLAVSHGVFLSHQGKLWAFHGAYFGKMQRIHTRAYSLDESTGAWTKHGVVITNGFWALNQPVRMADGNWIMPGIGAGPYSDTGIFPAAVAISHGDDFTKWDFVGIPASEEIGRMWGESSVFVDGATVYNIARYGGGAFALVAVSKDYGRIWTASKISNLPMATSKPAAGVLSTGQRYLVCTTTKDTGGRRSPLTIAVSRPGENTFAKVFVIRRSLHPGQPGESAERVSLSYPCATEHDGKLYVGFSNNGGRKGNLNSAELAILPIKSLRVEP